MAQMWLSQHPLKNAGVFPTSRKKMTIVMEKGNVGHMAAMPTIDMAGSLWIKGNIFFLFIFFTEYDLIEWQISQKTKQNSPLAGNRG